MNRGAGETVLLLAFSTAVLLSFGSCGPTASLVPINDQCICPGGTLRINCTAVGGGITTWAGTAFARINCSQISLNHGQYPALIDSGEPRFCPNMVMVIRALSVDGSCYTSQLTIPSVTAEFNGSTITCQHDTTVTTNIGMYNIIYTTDPFPPPNNVSITAITSDGLTFSWENVAPACLSLSYELSSSSGCGECPETTNSTSVTCSRMSLSGDVQMCNFSVRAISCGNLIGSYSQPLIIQIQAPRVSIIPRYALNSVLISFMVVIEELAPVSISGNDVMVQAIQVNYSTSDVPGCSSSETRSCDQGVCTGEINVITSSSPSCMSLNSGSVITVNVAATSVLGMGPTTTLRIDGTSRNFVQVMSTIENTTRLIVTCQFTNQLDSSNKSCDVSYGLCERQSVSRTAQGISSPDQTNIARVVLDFDDSADMYCFNVTASNGTFTAFIENSTSSSMMDSEVTTTTGITASTVTDGGGISDGAIVGIVIGVVILIIAIILAAISIIVLIIFKDRDQTKEKSPRHVHFHSDPDTSVVQVEVIDDVKIPIDSLRVSEPQTPGTPGTPGISATSPFTAEEGAKALLETEHPGEVPVAVARHQGEETLKAINKRFWIPEEWTMRKLERRIRMKDLGFPKDHAPLYLIVDKAVVEGALTLKEVYETRQHKGDKYLHIAYSSTEPEKS